MKKRVLVIGAIFGVILVAAGICLYVFFFSQKAPLEKESESPIEMVQNHFTSYLNNETKAVCNEYTIYGSGTDYIECMHEGDRFTLEELIDSLNTNPSTLSVQYTYLDCGVDGKPELALKITGLDIYSEGDDSYAFYVFYDNGTELELAFCNAYWARSGMNIYQYGYLTEYGSGGAALHYYDEYLLDGRGDLMVVANVIEMGDYYAYDLEVQDIFNEMGMSADDSSIGTAVEYILGEKKYLLFAYNENVAPNLYNTNEKFLALWCHNLSFTRVEADNISIYMDNRRTELDSTRMSFEEKEPEWNKLSVN